MHQWYNLSQVSKFFGTPANITHSETLTNLDASTAGQARGLPYHMVSSLLHSFTFVDINGGLRLNNASRCLTTMHSLLCDRQNAGLVP